MLEKRKAPTNQSESHAKVSNYIHNQRKKVLESFEERPKTMLMVSSSTGIERANVCRYVAELMRCESIMPVKKTLCEVSKHEAVYYSAVRKLF